MAGTMHQDPATSEHASKNTNIWSTRQLVTMALLCAIGVLLSFIEIPLVPAAPFLKYDPSAVPAMVAAFAYGPGPGLAIGVIGAIIHGILYADLAGCIMNILVIIGYVVPAGIIYRKSRTFKSAVIGLVASLVLAIIMAMLGNLLVTSMYMGVPVESVIEMIIPILLPFNLIKGIANCALTLVIYKSISNLITPKKDQVKGR